MLLKLLLIVSLLCFTTFNRLKAEESTLESGDGDLDIDEERSPDEVDDGDSDTSGDGTPASKVTVSINQRKPPSVIDDDYEEENDGDQIGGNGFVIDQNEGEDVTSDTNHWNQDEPVHVEENSLITHPGILAAIIIGGVLVLVCLIVFFVLIICCVRKKDEGTYDLDEAMKQKLKYVAYTKAETSPDKEFFA